VKILKDFYSRNGRDVDKELREVFVTNLPNAVVNDAQVAIVREQVSKSGFQNVKEWELMEKER
tara:strand:- start:330 stop:518 length:189 start_codon:yes stop_codon:yes gene_type:complete